MRLDRANKAALKRRNRKAKTSWQQSKESKSSQSVDDCIQLASPNQYQAGDALFGPKQGQVFNKFCGQQSHKAPEHVDQAI